MPMLQVGAAGKWGGGRDFTDVPYLQILLTFITPPTSRMIKLQIFHILLREDIIVDQIPFPRNGLQIQSYQNRDSVGRGRIGEEELRGGTHFVEKSEPTSSSKQSARKKLTSRPISCPSVVVPISLAASDAEPDCGPLRSIVFVKWPSLLCRNGNQNLLFSFRKRLGISSSHFG
jgi:hypothetical protein